MTIHNNAAPLGRDPIHEAIDILTVATDELHNAHTINPDDWTGEPEAKAEYDRTLRVVAGLSKLRAEGMHAGEPVADTAERQCPRCTGNGTILRLSGNGPDAYDVQGECPNCEGAGVVASVPVAGEALRVATVAMQLIRRSALDAIDRQQHDKLIQDFAALHERPISAHQVSEAECSCPSGDGSLRHPCAVHSGRN